MDPLMENPYPTTGDPTEYPVLPPLEDDPNGPAQTPGALFPLPG